MKFALTILGVNAATPAYGRFPTSQVLQFNNQFFLLDCGEGAQMRMSDYNIPRNKIRQIFISHLHGDHVFGLPGLLFSFDLNGRQEPLDIYAPIGLQAMVLAQLRPGGLLSYPVNFLDVNTVEAGLVFENNEISVESIPLRHGVPTVGYIFREKPRPLNIRPEKISEFQLSIPQIKEAKAGGNIVLANGQVIENEEITLPPVPLRSYGFLTDTVCDEVNLPYLEGLTMLYHDTTFCDDHADNASLTMHSTVKQAAALAKKAKVGRLLTGHYSSRYRDLSIFLEEGQSVFPDTVLGQEGVTYQI